MSVLRRYVDFLRQFAFQVGSFILMNNATLGQLVDHRGYFRKLLTHFFTFQRLEIADRVTGGFAVVFVPIPTFCCLTHIFFRCLVISHS